MNITKEADFEKLMNQHKGIIYKVVNSYCQHQDDRQDLAQEILTAMWLAFERYNSEFKFSTWMYRIALNVAISYYRKDSRREDKPSGSDEPLINIADMTQEDNSEEIRQLYRFISQLDKLNKAIIILYLEGESYEAIAHSLGISKTNVPPELAELRPRWPINFKIRSLNMNIDDLKNTWDNQSGDVNAQIEINQPLLASLEANQQMKELQSIKRTRIIECVVFLMIIVSLWQYIANHFVFSAPTISALLLNVFAIIGLATNIGQITLISTFDYAAPVKDVQQNMYDICAHKLQSTKLVLLSVPFYMSYTFLGFDVLFGIDFYALLSDVMVAIYAVSSLALLVVTLWVISQLSYKNINRPWVKWSLGFIVGKRLIAMAEFLNDAETT